MTAEVVPLFPTGAQAEDTIRGTVRGLLKGRGLSVEDVAPRANMSVSTLYRKLGAKGERDAFKAGEVASLALALGVEVGQLYSGLGGIFVPTPPDGGAPQRARRYSKPQPSDPKVLPVAHLGHVA